MTPEAKVKKKIHATLKAHGAYAVNYIGGMHANNGTPDILACLRGRFIGIEAKAGSNKPTDLQTSNLISIDKAGGLALVINETNVDSLPAYLTNVTTSQSNYTLYCKPLKDPNAENSNP